MYSRILFYCLCLLLESIISYNPASNWRNEYAFAAVRNDATAFTWGYAYYGASTEFNQNPPSNVRLVTSTSYAFAFMSSDGSVRFTGSSSYGGEYPTFDTLESITYIASTDFAFAALSSSGKVVSWQYSYSSLDNNLNGIQSGVTKIFSNPSTFVALKSDGSLWCWGSDSDCGYNSNPVVSSGATYVASTTYAFAVLKDDGSVTAFGSSYYGGSISYNGDSAALASGVLKIFGGNYCFAALKSDGSVSTWGSSSYGGYTGNAIDSLIASGCIDVKTAIYAIAVLKSNGQVIAWGSTTYGGKNGNAIPNGYNAKALYSNGYAFCALLSTNTQLYCWGYSPSGGSGFHSYTDGIKDVITSEYRFHVLLNDGRAYVISSSSVYIVDNVRNIFVNGNAVTYEKIDGTFYFTGSNVYGGTGCVESYLYSSNCQSTPDFSNTQLVYGTMLYDTPVDSLSYSGSTVCPSGTSLYLVNTTTGATYQNSTECSECHPGHFDATYACAPCLAGYYNSNFTQSACTSCPGGTFGNTTAATSSDSCYKCPPTTFSPGEGATQCTLCPAGTYSAEYGATGCTKCPGDTYNPNLGSLTIESCIPCPAGRVTAFTGEVDKDACINPEINFFSGLAFLFAIIPLSFEYLINGRFHRIAFLRKMRVVNELIKKAVHVGEYLFLYSNRAQALRTRNKSMRILYTYIFLFLSMLLIAFFVFISFMILMAEIFFKSMIIWRGFDITIPFQTNVEACVQGLADILSNTGIIYIFYPLTLAYDFFATFNINLESVEVTCAGSSAPLEMFLNLLILGTTVLVIESNYQLYRAITLSGTSIKFFEIVQMTVYQQWRRENNIVVGISIVAAIMTGLISGIDIFQNLLQYLMSSLTIVQFFPVHNVSIFCDRVPGYIYMDSFIGYTTSITAWSLVFPAVFEISKILIPGLPSEDEAKLEGLRYHYKEDMNIIKTSNWHWFWSCWKMFSYITPDLYIAAVTNRWIRLMRKLTPIDTCRDSFTLHTLDSMGIEKLETKIAKEDILAKGITTGTLSIYSEESEKFPRASENMGKTKQMKAKKTLEYISAPFQKRTQKEDTAWSNYVCNRLPSYYKLLQYQYKSLREDYNTPEVLCGILVIFGIGHYTTQVGIECWYVVLTNYFKFILLCLGYWDDDLLRRYEVLKLFESISISVPVSQQHDHITVNYEDRDFFQKWKAAYDKRSRWLDDYWYTQATDEDAAIFSRSMQIGDKHIKQMNLKRILRSEMTTALSQIVATRAVLLQVVPPFAFLSIYASLMSHTPIFVNSPDLLEHLPQFMLHFPFTESRITEEENIAENQRIVEYTQQKDFGFQNLEQCKGRKGKIVEFTEKEKKRRKEKNDKAKEYIDELKKRPRVPQEWVIFLQGLTLFITDSRAIGFTVNLYKFILVMAISFSKKEQLRTWMIVTCIVIIPYLVLQAININLIFGKMMDISDKDLRSLLSQWGLYDKAKLYMLSYLGGAEATKYEMDHAIKELVIMALDEKNRKHILSINVGDPKRRKEEITNADEEVIHFFLKMMLDGSNCDICEDSEHHNKESDFFTIVMRLCRRLSKTEEDMKKYYDSFIYANRKWHMVNGKWEKGMNEEIVARLENYMKESKPGRRISLVESQDEVINPLNGGGGRVGAMEGNDEEL